jgi:hypothetical protein
MRIGESGEERRQAVRQLFQLAGAQSAHPRCSVPTARPEVARKIC